jgi:hypothetical protein
VRKQRLSLGKSAETECGAMNRNDFIKYILYKRILCKCILYKCVLGLHFGDEASCIMKMGVV